MSNIGKHLIEITNYGSAWYRGTVIGETEKTYTVGGSRYRHREHRVRKSDDVVLLPASADAEAAVSRHDAAMRLFSVEIDALKLKIRETQLRRNKAALDQLKAEGAP